MENELPNEPRGHVTELTIPKPHPKQKEALLAPQRFIVANCGRRGGKSTYAFIKTLLAAFEKQGNYYIVCPTYKQAKSIYWNDIIKSIVPKELIHASNETELSIELKPVNLEFDFYGKKIKAEHDPNKPLSKIFLKGVDNPDSLRGVKLAGCVMDEFAFMENGLDVFKKIIRPALGDMRGWCVFISTPNGIHNDFYSLRKRALDEENWWYTNWTARDNPHFPAEEWTDAEREHEREGREDEWNQEWLAMFTNPAALVYSQFSEDVHVFRDPKLIPEEGTTYALSNDFGYVHPNACVFVQIDTEGNWYVYDEFYETERETEEIVAALRNKMGDDRFTYKLGDSQAKQQIADMRSKGLYLKPSPKGADSIQAGIRLVNGLLHVRESTGKPKLFVYYKCTNLIREFESYSRLKDKLTGERLETPEDDNNHALDALRYLALKILKPRKQRRKAKKTYDPNTGRLLKVTVEEDQ